MGWGFAFLSRVCAPLHLLRCSRCKCFLRLLSGLSHLPHPSAPQLSRTLAPLPSLYPPFLLYPAPRCSQLLTLTLHGVHSTRSMITHLSRHCTKLQRLALHDLTAHLKARRAALSDHRNALLAASAGHAAVPLSAAASHASPPHTSADGGGVDWRPLGDLRCLSAFHLTGSPALVAGAAAQLAASRQLLKHLKLAAAGVPEEAALAIVSSACDLPLLSWLSLSLKLSHGPRQAAGSCGAPPASPGLPGVSPVASPGDGPFEKLLKEQLVRGLPSTALELDIVPLVRMGSGAAVAAAVLPIHVQF